MSTSTGENNMSLQKRIQEACNDLGEVNYQSYSGRGMYGKTCVGIVGSHSDCLKVIAEVIKQQADEAVDSAMDCSDDEQEMRDVQQMQIDLGDNIDTLLNYRQDGMGYDVVIYWPNLAFEGEEDVSEDDDN